MVGIVVGWISNTPEWRNATNFWARFWVEFRVVRIIWKRLWADVVILNDGNIYFDSKIVSLGMMILGICKVWDVILAKYWRSCVLSAFLMELGAVRFKCQHIFGDCAYNKRRQHLFWWKMHFWAWWFWEFVVCETHFDHNNDIYAFVMELMVVRINWEHILAIVPM